jgi:hypothetical protein
MKLLFRVV